MKRAVADPEPAFYTTEQLRARYGGAAKSTIYRNIRRRGFPPPDHFGNRNLFSIEAVHAWERIHMPHLHPGKSGTAGEFEVLAADEKRWEQFRVERQLRVAREARERNKAAGSVPAKRRPGLRGLIP
jgi:hypothetical protein